MSVTDLVVDAYDEALLTSIITALGGGRLIMDRESPEDGHLTKEGYLVIRIKDRDPIAYARELQRRMMALRIVKVVDRTPKG